MPGKFHHSNLTKKINSKAGACIEKSIAEGKSQKQAVAIAYSEGLIGGGRKSKKKKGGK